MNNRHILKISGLTNDSVVDGPGLRFTIFTQGCRHFCKGCHNPTSHDESGGYDIYIDDILEQISENPLLDGITISGGEPFLQHGPLSALASDIKRQGMNVMVYTGYTWEELIDDYEKYKGFLNEIDILVDGRFIALLKSYSLKYKGSSNQRIIDVKSSLAKGTIVLREE